jgi:hypothetical protein
MKTDPLLKFKLFLGVTLALGLLTGCASERCEKCGAHQKMAGLQAQAKISQADAQQTALAKVPNGTVKDGELEKEGGKLIWSFDIATPGSQDITEVAVDAISGAVVSVEKETPADQAKEKAADAKEKKDKD